MCVCRVVSLAFVPGTDFLISASHDGTARVWDCGTGELVRALEGHTNRVTKASPDCKGAREQFVFTAMLMMKRPALHLAHMCVKIG